MCVCVSVYVREMKYVSVIEFLHVFTKFAPKILLYMCVCVCVLCLCIHITYICTYITYICTYNYNTFFSSHFLFFSLEIFINMHKVCLGEIVFLLFRFLSFFVRKAASFVSSLLHTTQLNLYYFVIIIMLMFCSLW